MKRWMWRTPSAFCDSTAATMASARPAAPPIGVALLSEGIHAGISTLRAVGAIGTHAEAMYTWQDHSRHHLKCMYAAEKVLGSYQPPRIVLGKIHFRRRRPLLCHLPLGISSERCDRSTEALPGRRPKKQDRFVDPDADEWRAPSLSHLA